MWRCDNMDIENCNGLVDELKKHMDDWRDFTICEKCGVAIIIGPQGDLRNYLYPQPDFPIEGFDLAPIRRALNSCVNIFNLYGCF